MHAGSIDNASTAAGRVYRALLNRQGEWIGGWDLSQAAHVTAVSTRVSEVRHELERLERPERIEVDQQGRLFFYRIVSTAEPGEQLSLLGDVA